MANKFDEVPGVEPRDLISSDLWTWTRDDLAADYPPADYTLRYNILGVSASPTTFTFDAAESGGSFLVELSSATTASYAPGEYNWYAHIIRKSDSARITVGEGQWTVADNPFDGTDPRPYPVRLLAAIEGVIEGKLTKDVASYTIEGRSLVKIPLPELISLRDKLRGEVAAIERRKNKRGVFRTHPVEFT